MGTSSDGSMRELMQREKLRRAAEVLQSGKLDSVGSVKKKIRLDEAKNNQTEKVVETGNKAVEFLPSDFFDEEVQKTTENGLEESQETGQETGHGASADITGMSENLQRESADNSYYELVLRDCWAQKIEEEVEGVRYVDELMEVEERGEFIVKEEESKGGGLGEDNTSAGVGEEMEDVDADDDVEGILPQEFVLQYYDPLDTAYHSRVAEYKEKEKKRLEEEEMESKLPIDELQKEGKIPIGFFDDADKDAEARGKVGPTKHRLDGIDQEVQLFEAEIGVEAEKEELIRHRSDARRFNEEFELQLQVQRKLKDRLKCLEEKRELAAKNAVAGEAAKSIQSRGLKNEAKDVKNEEDDDDDAAEWEEDLLAGDWRAKRTAM